MCARMEYFSAIRYALSFKINSLSPSSYLVQFFCLCVLFAKNSWGFSPLLPCTVAPHLPSSAAPVTGCVRPWCPAAFPSEQAGSLRDICSFQTAEGVNGVCAHHSGSQSEQFSCCRRYGARVLQLPAKPASFSRAWCPFKNKGGEKKRLFVF